MTRMPRLAANASTLANLDPAVKEELLLERVLRRCRELGLRTMHIRPARTATGWRTPYQGDGKGWPDLTIVGNREIHRELKSNSGRLRPEQKLWIQWLTDAGSDIAVWTPDDWDAGRIDAQLIELTKPIPLGARDAAAYAEESAALRGDLEALQAELDRLREAVL